MDNKKKVEYIREIILVVLLILWMVIPILKEIKGISVVALEYEYDFIKIVGSVGLIFLFLDIFQNLKHTKTKKEYVKQILPIIILFIFMVWTFISTMLSNNTNQALFGTEYRKDGYISYLAYAGFFSCTFLIKSKENKKALINFFVSTAIVNIILVELWNKGLCSNIIEPRAINRTCFFNSNHYGYYLTLATIAANFLFVTEKNKIIKIVYVVDYLFLLYYIMLNNTFGCYLAIAFTLIAFLGYCIYHKQKRIIAIISIGIFILMPIVNPKVNKIVFNNINSLISDFNNLKISVQTKDSEEAVIKAEAGGSGRIRLWKYRFEIFYRKATIRVWSRKFRK